MGVVCLTCRTLGRQVFLKRGVLVLTSILLLLVVLGVYSFMQYSTSLQEASRSASIIRIVEEESEIPIVIKKNDLSSNPPKPVNSLNMPVGNNSLPQLQASIKTVEVDVPQVQHVASDDETFLQLTGKEDECLFSAAVPEHKPTVNVLDLLDELAFDNPDGGVWKQGYDIKYDVASFKEEPLQVFVAPHSHNDPGWIKTFQDYYAQQTRHILTSVVSALEEDQRRRFIWAEISFFDLWWNEQSAERKELTKKLIKNGQLEIVTGGWVMNDEANTHYFAMIDQLMEGHQWLEDNIGVKPISGWAIDPFGYTPTMAYLLRRMGFHNMLIQRIHYALKKHLSKKQQMEFLWRQSWDHSSSTDMLCHMMPFYSYDVPHTCGPDPKICCQFDFLRLPGHRVSCPWRVPAQVITGSNVQERASLLLDQYRKKAQLYRTNVLLVPLGDDFRYDSSAETHDQYNNYQRIFSYFDSHPELNVKAQFGTLRDYFTALRKSTGVSGSTHPPGYPTLSGDFFTYCDREHDYWSGYYTSRPFYKNLDRILEDRLRAAEIVYTLAKAESLPLVDGLDALLTKARRHLGLFQHHDGITGTAKNHVVVDYGNRLLQGVNGADRVMAASAQALLLGKSQTHPGDLIFDVSETRAQHDALPEKKIISLAEDEKRVVCLYNSLTHSRQELVSLVVSSASVSVYDADDNPIASQINPVMSSNNIDSAKYEVVFMAKLAPLSVTKYHVVGVANQLTMMATVECSSGAPSSSIFKTSAITSQSPFTLSTEHLEVSFDGSTGLIQSVRTPGSSNREVRTTMDFTTYSSRSSGAYLFLPNGGAESIVKKSSLPYCVTKGPMLHRVQVTMEMITHTAQLSNSPGVDGQSIYLSNTVDVRRETNKELIMKISTSINNNDRVYYTDLNGFQTVRRKTLDKLTTQGNFYPMPSFMFLQDTTSRMTLLSGQPLGVSSRETGVVEVVLDRRLSMDDNRGLGHGVTDNKVTLSSFRLLVEHRSSADPNPTRQVAYPSLMAHYTSSVLTLPIHYFIMRTSSNYQLAASYSGLKGQLPCDIHMLNLRSRLTSSSTQAALLLHRKGFDCGFNAALLTCQLTGGQISAQSIFTRQPSSSQPMSLTMMYPSDATPDHIDPMEITTHKLSWS